MKYVFSALLVFVISSGMISVAKAADEECVFLAEVYDTGHKDEFPLQFCMYKHTEVRGIFAATACVGVLIESQSGTRHPFYGSKGHWGIEGECSSEKILKKLNDPETMKTVNPVTDIQAKRKHGMKLRILKDNLKIGDTLVTVTKP